MRTFVEAMLKQNTMFVCFVYLFVTRYTPATYNRQPTASTYTYHLQPAVQRQPQTRPSPKPGPTPELTYTHSCMHSFMHACACAYAWMCGRIDRRTYAQMDAWTYGSADGCMDANNMWMNALWGCMCVSISLSLSTYIYIYVCIYMYTCIVVGLSLSIYIHIYIYIYTYVYTYISIHIYI